MRRTASTLLAIAMLTTGLAAARADEPNRPRAVREADTAVHFAEIAGRRLLDLLDDARVRGASRQITCVDGRLMQVNAFGRTLQDRRTRLLRAVEQGDANAARHERRVIRNLHAQLRRLEREGRACVFPGASAAHGRTVVEVIVGPEVPSEDVAMLDEDERRRRW